MLASGSSPHPGEIDTEPAPRAQRAEPPKLAYIDAMRGLAILLVLVVHAEQNARSLGTQPADAALRFVANLGQFGVQMFFVVSAYTLCLSFRRRENTGKNSWLAFGIRRFFRIAPLYYAGIVLYTVLAILRHRLGVGNPAAIGRYDAGSIACNLLLVHGFTPWANNGIVPGGWSIGTEAAFYALFPLLLACYRWIGAGRKGLLLLPPALGFCAAMTLNGVEHARHGVWVEENGFLYNSIWNQLPTFLIGMTLYFLLVRRGVEWRRRTCAGGALVFAALTVLTWGATGLACRCTVAPFAAALCFACLIAAVRDARWTSHWLLVRLGTISYSVYIVHFAALWGHALLLRRIFGTSLGALGGMALLLAVTLPSVIVVAWLCERLIERSGIAMGRCVVQRFQQLSPPASAAHEIPAQQRASEIA